MAGIGYWAISYAAEVPGMWNAIASAVETASVENNACHAEGFIRVPEGAANIVVYDVTGRVTSDASHTGMYFVRFTYEGREHVIKLINP
jgi:hypothetical protein